MPDTRYLKKRGGRWSFQIAVPKDLQERFGRAVITQALGTSEIRVAKDLRWKLLATAKEAFKKAREGQGLSSLEIEDFAQKELRKFSAKLESSFKPDPHHIEVAGNTGDPVVVALSDVLHDLQYELAEGNYGRVKAQVEKLIKQTGAVPGDQGREELSRAMLKAQTAAYVDALDTRQGEQPTPTRLLNTASTAIAPARTKRGKGMAFSEAAKSYVEERSSKYGGDWTNHTKGQNQATFRLFQDFISNSPVDSVTRNDALKFRSTIARLKPSWAKSYKAKGKKLSALLKLYSVKEGEVGLSTKTLERYSAALSGLFSYLIDRESYEGNNPFSRLSDKRSEAVRLRKQRTKYLPFKLEELKALFQSPLLLMEYGERVNPKMHDMKSAMRWIPLIALFTGMRSGEIAQLRPEDIRRENEIDFFEIAEGTGQKLKTAAAYRKIPIHFMLIRCGFLDYVKNVKDQEFIFPGLKPGGADNKRNHFLAGSFRSYRLAVGVKRERVAFHSFRATVATALENSGVLESQAVQLLGHQKMSMSYGLYSGGLDLKGLRRVVEKIGYSGLNLSHLYKPTKG